MKILHLVQTLDPATGGVARAVLGLHRALPALGHLSHVVAIDDPAAAWVPPDGSVTALGKGLGSYQFSTRLPAWLEEHGADFDAVVVHGLWQHLSLAAWRRYARSETPYFVFPHGMLDPWFKRTYPLKHLKKWLYWPWAEYRVLRDAAAVIFTCEEEKLEARKSFWLYRARERVSPLGVEDPAALEKPKADLFRATFPGLNNRRVILYLGRLDPKKGGDLLLEAFEAIARDHADPALVFAGPDLAGWGDRLRRQAAASACRDRILFTGMLEGELKQAALAAADVFILPSHQENFGLAVAEALAHGLPVLLSDRVNIWREIEQDGAGFVEPDNLAGTERLLRRWLALTPGTQEEMRGQARRCFTERFEIGQATQGLLKVLEEFAS